MTSHFYLSMLVLLNFQTDMLVLGKPVNYSKTISSSILSFRTSGVKRPLQNLHANATQFTTSSPSNKIKYSSSINTVPPSSSTNTPLNIKSTSLPIDSNMSRDDRQSNLKSNSSLMLGYQTSTKSVTFGDSGAIVFPTRRTTATSANKTASSTSIRVYWNTPPTIIPSTSNSFMETNSFPSTTNPSIRGLSTANQTTTPMPVISFKDIITVPQFKCRDDEKKDEEGKCRVVYDPSESRNRS